MRRTGVVVGLVCGLLLAACGADEPVDRPVTGDHRLTLDVGGKQRTVLLHVPPGYTGDRPVPLVVGLHFYPGSGTALRDMIGMDARPTSTASWWRTRTASPAASTR